VRFTALIASYLDHQRTYNKRETLRSAEHSLRVLLAWFGDRELETLSHADLDAFVRHRRAQVKDVSVNKDLRVLRGLLRFGLGAGHLPELPVRVRLLRVAQKRELRVLGGDEVEALLRHARGHYYGISLVAAQTAFRTGEILHLQWRDVYFDENRIAVTSKPGWSAKSHQERSVFASERVMNHLRRLHRDARHPAPTDWIFATRNGTPLSRHNTAREVRKIFERAGFYEKGRPLLHWLRHSACSNLLGAGVDIETCRQIMGHRSIQTTQLYAHTTDERLRRASRLVGLVLDE
jgi:site-specific recombinase XerD